MKNHTPRRSLIAIAAATAVAASLLGAAPALAGTGPLNLGPTVTYTGQGPTGYSVTFRYQSTSATSVQVYGEWYFSKPSSITSLTGADMRLGADWQPGDVPAGYNNKWRTSQMTEVDTTNGIWQWTTPLPSGTFTYAYTEGCTTVDATGCTLIADPANPEWNAGGNGAQNANSQVYVPQSPNFPTYDNDYQAPAATTGTLVDRSYPSPLSTNPVGTHNVAIYLPPDYDPTRSTPYPTLYLSHGAGGTETDWTTQGVAQNIFDNAFASGDAQSMVIVSTNFNGLPGGNQGYADELKNNVIPFIESNYDVSKKASDRAFGGLSAGGARGLTLLYDNTSLFDYYGLWSAASNYTTPTDTQVANAKGATAIQMGVGLEDWLSTGQPIQTSTLAREAGFRQLGIATVNTNLDGIHSWDVWRQELDTYIKDVAFKSTSVTVGSAPGAISGTPTSITAHVTPHTTTNVAPTGSVAFYANGDATSGTLLGRAAVQADGTSNLSAVLTGVGNQSLTAVYEGDDLYNTATSTAATVAVAAPTAVVPTITINAASGVYGKGTSATVAVARAGAPATGEIIAKLPGFDAIRATLVGGTAVIALPATVGAGSHELVVSYPGDANTVAILGSATVKVAQASAKTTLSLSTAKATVKKTKVKATVKVSILGSTIVPTGSVRVRVDGHTVKLVKLTASNTGSLTVTLPAFSKTGTRTVTAKYVGNSNVKAKTSAVHRVKVAR